MEVGLQRSYLLDWMWEHIREPEADLVHGIKRQRKLRDESSPCSGVSFRNTPPRPDLLHAPMLEHAKALLSIHTVPAKRGRPFSSNNSATQRREERSD